MTVARSTNARWALAALPQLFARRCRREAMRSWHNSSNDKPRKISPYTLYLLNVLKFIQ
jgi:hypothetical protein